MADETTIPERLTKLEAKTCERVQRLESDILTIRENCRDFRADLKETYREKFSELDKAMVLARDIVRMEKDAAKKASDEKLEKMNDLQRKMDKQETGLAKKDDLAALENRLSTDIRANSKKIWIGIGLAMAIGYFVRMIKL